MKKVIFTLFIFVCSIGHAEIRTAATLAPIAQEFKKSDSHTLVLLDIGGTLLAYKDPFLHKAHEQWTKSWFKENCPNITKDETIGLVRLVEAYRENWQLVDATWPQIIEKAKANNAKVIGFTKVLGLKGNRAKRLAEFGLIVSNDYALKADSGTLFEYADGIIETEAELKGPVFTEVLLQMIELPQKVIFVDDRIEQIQSVHEVCQKHNIPCIAFHYTATENIPHLDVAVASYQLHMLVHHKTWVGAEESKRKIQRQ